MEDWLKQNGKDLFSERQIKIPTPHFVVFYNGLAKRPEFEEMRLSRAFCLATEKPEIEVICSVYNINPNNNLNLKERSAVLDGYTYFVEKVRGYQRQNMKVEDAVNAAIDDCIREHVLEDFFRNRKDEIKKMTHLDYTWEKREKLIRKEEYEEGITQGVSQARKDVLLRMIARGDSKEQILELGYSEDEYHQVIQ